MPEQNTTPNIPPEPPVNGTDAPRGDAPETSAAEPEPQQQPSQPPQPAQQPSQPPQPPVTPRRKRPLAWRITKWLLITVLVLAVIVVGILGLGVWLLTPQKLTPMVEKAASSYLKADVTAASIKLTYWETFPQLVVEVDSLCIISHALDSIPAYERERLPQGADSLLFVGRFSGKVDLPSLLAMKIKLRDIDLGPARANLVMLSDSVSNLDIFPPSESADTASTIPDITLNRLRLTHSLHVRYFNAADTTDLRLALSPTTLDAEKVPQYRLTTGGDVSATIGSLALPPVIAFGFDGDITWEAQKPMQVTLSDCVLSAGPVAADLSTALDFEHGLLVKELAFATRTLSVTEVIDWLPEVYTANVKGMKTDMQLALRGKLLGEWRPASGELPSADVSVDIPPCKLSYQQMNLSRVELHASAHYDAAAPAHSLIDVSKVTLVGEGIGVNFVGTATDLLRDPLVKGTFRGGINFAKVPSAIMQMLPFALKGTLRANADLRLRPSYLDRLNFHRVKINGEASLNNFSLLYTDSSGSIYARSALLKFGSSQTITTRRGNKLDSLLTAKLTVDTIAYDLDGMVINADSLNLGLGVSNKAASADTAVVVPLGMTLSASRIRYVDVADSSRIVLRSPKIYATVRRFKDSAKRPLINAGIRARRIRYGSPLGRITLSDPAMNLSLHPNARPRMSRRVAAYFDSLQALYPTLRSDSLLRMAQREARAARRSRKNVRDSLGSSALASTGSPGRPSGAHKQGADSVEMLDFRADRETRSLLRWWDASGSIKAKRGRILTPFFPLKNRLSDVDLKFDMDTFRIISCRLKSGRSDFSLHGEVTNFTNAMLRRNAAIKARLDITGDTVDVNQLTEAAFLGAAYSEHVQQLSPTLNADGENDDLLQEMVEKSAADSVTGPLLMPMNLDARLRMRSKVALYEGLKLTDFIGEMLLHEGALQLREFGATTDAGRVSLNALYAAPNVADMHLGLGLVLDNFYVERFTKLFPTLDSIMPVLNAVSGRINAEMVATSDVEPNMDINIPSLSALLTIRGDSLTVIDPETYKTIAKWLRFKDRDHNLIDSISTQLAIQDNQLEVYPFIFNFDRYRLGVMGSNDLDMNLNYHVSVLKSPLPFKFGINIKGSVDDMKIRLGGAKIKENMVVERVKLVKNSRVNLMHEMDNVFARGMRSARMRRLNARDEARRVAGGILASPDELEEEKISTADSLMLHSTK